MQETIIAEGDKINDQHLVVLKPGEKLNQLNELQVQVMESIRKFWLDYIFSCKNNIDRPKIENGIEWLYKLVGLESPVIIFLESPMAAQYGVSYLKAILSQVGQQVEQQVGQQVEQQVRQQVGQQVWQQVWQQVEQQVRQQVRQQVGQQVWQQVRQQVRQQVEQQVGQQVWQQVEQQVRQQVGQQVRQQVWQQVGQQVRQQVWQQVEQQVRQQVEQQVGQQVWQQVEQQVGQQVEQQVGQQVWQQVWQQVGQQVGQQLSYESFSWYGNISDFGWISFYDFFTQIGVINNDKFNNFKELLLSGVYDMIQLQGFCIVCGLPSKVHRNEAGRLHNTTGAAIEWADGYKQYYINGRALPEWIWQKAEAGEITLDMFLNEKNDEIRSGIYEVLGNERMMEMLGATEIDSTTLTHGKGEMETVSLYKTKKNLNKVKKKPYAWIKRVCPSTGTVYLTPTNPDFTTALEAAKFHRPAFVPVEVDYIWQSRS